jgi:UDP-N-acetylglucosamine 2-epimerase (non-hydrolysing)
MIVDLVVGARPNYMKAAAIYHAWRERYPQSPPFTLRLIDTGQHHEPAMSREIGAQLELPQPDVFLSASGASTTELTAHILLRYGALLQKAPPAATIVVGDVTSTLAAALAARQAGIFLVHVEAGLRSRDRSMPEEHNRMLTDALSDLLLVTSEKARQNLLEEGVAPQNIEIVGNTMIDTLCRQLPFVQQPNFWDSLELEAGNYLLLTLHRPANVDSGEVFLNRLHLIARLAEPFKVVFPLHTRTAAFLKGKTLPANMRLIPPQDYLTFLYLLKHCSGILTDSGGASEEAAFLQKRCLIMRSNTERPETLSSGSAVLIGEDEELLQKEIFRLHQETYFPVWAIPLWDGFAGRRILEILEKTLEQKNSVNASKMHAVARKRL